MTSITGPPTPAEIAQFQTSGYLVLPEFLALDHVAVLKNRLELAIKRRRTLAAAGMESRAKTEVVGPNTRIFHVLEDDPAFLDVMDHKPVMAYVRAFLTRSPHFHASDAIWESGASDHGPQWHPDGGYLRVLERPTPLMQLKVGYYLSDMTKPGRGNLMLVPGSHRNVAEPLGDQKGGYDTMPGAIQICGPTGTAVMFHNAVWHTRGPSTDANGQRIMLYYAYEHGFMLGNPEHWSYSSEFYAGLSPERSTFFHGFVFNPQEWRFS